MLDTLVVDLPACISQQGRDPAIAVAAVLAGQIEHVGHQSVFVCVTLRDTPLRGAMLPQNPAGAFLRNVLLVANMAEHGQ